MDSQGRLAAVHAAAIRTAVRGQTRSVADRPAAHSQAGPATNRSVSQGQANQAARGLLSAGMENNARLPPPVYPNPPPSPVHAVCFAPAATQAPPPRQAPACLKHGHLSHQLTKIFSPRR
ncbi:MAG: hypothetical protein HN370_03090 [Phycisphaerales bacterium]|nr:hypothetical protein [Phycisphaerales bacterium]